MSVTYYTAPGQVSFTAVATIGLPVWERPFPELTSQIVFRQRFMQRADSYAPLAMNTAYPSTTYVGAVSYYLVGEENFQDESGGLLTWDRVYAAVPSTRREYTAMAYQYPAVIRPYSSTIGSYANTQYVQASGPDRMFIATSITAGPGEHVALSYKTYSPPVQMEGVLVVVREQVNGGLLTDINSSFIATTYNKAVARVTRSSGTIARPAPLEIVGRAIVECSYTLVTAGVTPDFTFQSRQKYLYGTEQVDYVSEYTSPTAASYAAMVSSGSYLIAEDDTWTRWMGNIYEKKTTSILAL